MTFQSTDLIRASARLNYDAGGPDLVNVMYFEMLSPSSLSDALLVADIGQALEVYYSTIVAVLNNQIEFTDIAVKNETADAAPIISSWPTLTIGGNAGDALPSQVAALVLARTGKSRKQGRVNLSGLVEVGVSGNTWSGSTLTALVNFAAQLLVTQIMTNGNYRYVVASAGVVPPRTIVNSADVPISSSLVPFARTQRRRSQGFGS